MEIAQIQHYEVVNSRIYSFYLQNTEHGFRDLFLKSLIELIHLKWVNTKPTKPEKPFFELPGDWNCSTEVATKKGNRIDLWIDWDSKEGDRKTILIENKIFHFLRNDLEDYFDTPGGKAKDKVGVLLTLGEQNAGHEHFINITHEEWLSQIRKNWGEYIPDADDRHLLFLKDFMLNMSKLVKNLEKMHDFIQYYIQHREQIESLLTARNNFAAKVLDSFSKAGEHLKWGVLHKSANHYRALQVNPAYDFKLTGVFNNEPVWKYPFYIVLEIFGKLLPQKDALRGNEGFLTKFTLERHDWGQSTYAHIAGVGYDFQDIGNKDLITYFEEQLDQTWKPACDYLVTEILSKP